MKIYEKPKLMVLSLSANDALCACAATVRDDPFFFPYDTNKDGKLDSGEINASGYFGSTEECKILYGKYCKHTPDGLTLFNS